MRNFKYFSTVLITFFALYSFGQQKTDAKKITVSGKIVEKSNQSELEYATITLKNPQNPKMVFGGISDKKGMFSIEVAPGMYDILIEFISLKSYVINQKSIDENYNMGIIALEENINELQEVVVRSEKTTVEFKLDKKVYNVGKDLMVKGGTVSDVLDNIPSVSVDMDGNVSLRGNSSVKILVDGRPSSAINISEALRLIPADAIDKVEVITNPSARYDAEGGGGIVNIILKKGKNQGVNGSVVANAGYPETYGLTGNLNYKTKKVNLFTTQGYNYRNNPGNAFVDSRYLNEDDSTKNFMYETR
ncbi:MAG: TonB-dependent receptor plug domain-containing protein, partial [Flavobacterium sp.]